MSARAELHALYERRHALAEGGGAAIGCITHAVPIELILAAGLRPVRLFGNPSRPPTLGDRYMEAEMDGEVRSLFDRFLAGDLAGLPLVLLPRVSEQHLQLHYYVAEVRSWEPQANIPPVEIVNVMQTAYWSTGRYVRARLDELAARLAQSGRPITDESLRRAIAETNSMRRALRALNARRRASSFKGSDMLRITALFGALPARQFLKLAEALAADAGSAAQGPRLMVSGSLQDEPSLYELIEAHGASVVADDHVAGERLFAHLIDEFQDPMDALTDHCQLFVPGLRQYPQRPQDDRFIATCRQARIDAELCVLEDNDDTLGWDWPRRRDRLAALGIPSVLLSGQNYFHPDRAAQAAAVEALLERVREPAS